MHHCVSRKSFQNHSPISSIVGTIFYRAKVETVLCMCAAALSLGLTRRLDNLTYIESITDAYSQYFVNDTEHSESNKQQKCKLSLFPIT